MTRFLISVPNNLKLALKSVANERGQTLSGLIRDILWAWAKENGK